MPRDINSAALGIYWRERRSMIAADQATALIACQLDRLNEASGILRAILNRMALLGPGSVET